MTAHISMLRRLPHAMPRTALAACTCVLAIAATVNIGVDWAIDDSEWARYLCCGLVTTVAAIWFTYKPQQGSYVIIAVAVGDFLIGGTAFAPMLILALLATGSIGYTSLVEGVLSGIALLAAVFFSPYTVAFPVIDNSLLSFPCLVALTLSISALIRRNGERQRQLQREQTLLANAGIAQRLHDYTTNDLSDIAMMADHQLAICDSEQREAWSSVKNLALDALTHTRKAIRTLESDKTTVKQYNGTKTDDRHQNQFVSPRHGNDTPMQVSGATGIDKLGELNELIATCQSNLAANGYTGEVIRFGTEPTQLGDATATLVIGLVRELFGNIAKHARAYADYTMLISWTDAAFVIELSDVPKPSADAGLRSGLERYRRTIESMQGRWNVESADDHWSIHAEVPYRRTIC